LVDDEAKNLLIYLVWSVETPRYPAWLQGVWQSHSRHADLKKVSKQNAPKHPDVLGRAIRHAPHREAFIPDVNLGEVFRVGEGDDKAVGRSGDLTKATTEPKGGLKDRYGEPPRGGGVNGSR
jgi:hypothetical protein